MVAVAVAVAIVVAIVVVFVVGDLDHGCKSFES